MEDRSDARFLTRTTIKNWTGVNAGAPSLSLSKRVADAWSSVMHEPNPSKLEPDDGRFSSGTPREG